MVWCILGGLVVWENQLPILQIGWNISHGNNNEDYLDFAPSYPDNYIENGDDESDAFTFFPQEKNSSNKF